MKEIKLKLARIYWNDASHYAASNEISWLRENASGTELVTVGYVVKGIGKAYIIAHEISGEGNARNTSVIPKKMITKVDYLESKKKGGRDGKESGTLHTDG